MWLQLFSFQNILSNQSQQRLWPLVVWVQEEEKEEEEEEEGGGAYCAPEELCEFMNVNKHKYIES